MLTAKDVKIFSLLQRAIPPPLARFEASNLVLGSGTVSGWQNAGTLGSAFDLVLAPGNVAPELVPGAGPHGGDALRFRGRDFLQSLTDLPLDGSHDRVLLARIKLESGNGVRRNLFGYGRPDVAQLADMILTDSDQVALHEYYQGTEAVPTPLVRGQWAVVGFVFNQPPVLNDYHQYALLNTTAGRRSAEGQGGIVTALSPLRVGAGQYEPWNETNHVFLLDALRVYGSATDKQVQQMVQALLP